MKMRIAQKHKNVEIYNGTPTDFRFEVTENGVFRVYEVNFRRGRISIIKIQEMILQASPQASIA